MIVDIGFVGGLLPSNMLSPLNIVVRRLCLRFTDSFYLSRQVPWTEVVSNIANMTEKMDNFANRCKKLPSRLKEWDAFTQLRFAYALSTPVSRAVSISWGRVAYRLARSLVHRFTSILLTIYTVVKRSVLHESSFPHVPVRTLSPSPQHPLRL